MSRYNEDSLVQQTTAEYFQQKLGWDSVYAYNEETLGADSTLGRNSQQEVVLTRYLRAALVKFNQHLNLPEAAYQDAIRQITEASASQTMLATNREKYSLLKDGVQVSYRDAQGELKRERLRVFDFIHPAENHFLCVRELWVKGALYRRRADIIGFVNGLPLLFIELKNVHRDIRVAYDGNFQDYKDTIPHLFHHNAIVILANGTEAKIGSLTSKYEHFHEWKRLDESDPGVVDMETLLKGVCSKINFLDLFENFIVFDDSSGAAKKVLARNHQFLGVNLALQAVRDRKTRQGKLGVFWHTQGSGKSYSMVFFTRKVHRKLGGNFTFLICTDRDDLDTQIYKTFAGCGLADNDKAPCRAASARHLASLLSEHKAYVFSLIQKFNQKIESPAEAYSPRDDIIVITDEAHRTQYGLLSLNMRNALPNASYMGFTGTPLFKDDEITKKIFGDYISTYDFQRAVEDKATVPLYYDARGDKLGIATNDLNERIAQKLDEIELEDINLEQRLERELRGDYHILTAEKRLEQVARDFVDHYSNAWESGKAMLVCVDKITTVRLYKMIERHWQKRIAALEKSLRHTKDEQEEIYRLRQIEWMKTTRMAVVISEEQGEVDAFRKWDLDILPHRRLIKEGFELPDHTRIELESAFKKDDHPFRIAIVCAMWLTGFDVPSLATLYLDKPLKAHTLMQAIARANRVNEGKTNGLVVDYCGILKNLRQALATFAGKGDDARGEDDIIDPTLPDDELLNSLAEAVDLAREFLTERSASLDDIVAKTGFERIAAIQQAKEAANENDRTRKRFEVLCREVFNKFVACVNIKGVNAYRNSRDALSIVYKSLQKDREAADISDILRQLHQVVDEVISTQTPPISEERAPYDISQIDFERLRKEFERSPAKHTTVQNLKQAIEQRLQRLLEQNPLRTDFQRHYDEIVAEYNREKDRVTIEQTFEDLFTFYQGMDEEETRAAREGLDEETLALFDLLNKPELTPAEIKRIKAVAVELLAALKSEKLRIPQWREKETTRDAVFVTITNFLYDDRTGLPQRYTEAEVKVKADSVFTHIFRAYPTVPSPYYPVAT
jgi:type I restriction enzyme, R subunit